VTRIATGRPRGRCGSALTGLREATRAPPGGRIRLPPQRPSHAARTQRHSSPTDGRFPVLGIPIRWIFPVIQLTAPTAHREQEAQPGGTELRASPR
jgi:hypothetical protein